MRRKAGGTECRRGWKADDEGKGKKPWRFRKELKTFLRDILLIEPPASTRPLLCFLCTQVPFYLSFSFSLLSGLSPSHTLHPLPLSVCICVYSHPLSISIRLRISFAPTAIYLGRSFIAGEEKEEKCPDRIAE